MCTTLRWQRQRRLIGLLLINEDARFHFSIPETIWIFSSAAGCFPGKAANLIPFFVVPGLVRTEVQFLKQHHHCVIASEVEKFVFDGSMLERSNPPVRQYALIVPLSSADKLCNCCQEAWRRISVRSIFTIK